MGAAPLRRGHLRRRLHRQPQKNIPGQDSDVRKSLSCLKTSGRRLQEVGERGRGGLDGARKTDEARPRPALVDKDLLPVTGSRQSF